MDGIQVDCLYCGKVSTFIISDNFDFKNLRCNICSESKLIKKSKVSFMLNLKQNEIEQKKEPQNEPLKSLGNEEFEQSVDGGNGYGDFPDLYDDFFNYSQ